MSGSILIFGATSGTGFEAAGILKARGDQVSALVRAQSSTDRLEALGVDTIRGDVMDTPSVDAAFDAAEPRAVIVSLGGKRGVAARPDWDGARNVIDAAKKAGVRRLLMVTAIGTGDSRSAVAPKVLEVLGEILEYKTRAEDYLVSSGLDYTILRPGGLTSDPATGTAIRTDDHSVMGVITRADLARLVVDCLDDESTIGRTYHTVDPEIKWQAPLQRGEDLPARK